MWQRRDLIWKKYCKEGIATEQTNVDLCGVCSKTEKEGEEWLCCDICNIWYHRCCLDFDDEEWAAVSSITSIYICPMCSEEQGKGMKISTKKCLFHFFICYKVQSIFSISK